MSEPDQELASQAMLDYSCFSLINSCCKGSYSDDIKPWEDLMNLLSSICGVEKKSQRESLAVVALAVKKFNESKDVAILSDCLTSFQSLFEDYTTTSPLKSKLFTQFVELHIQVFPSSIDHQ